MGKKKRPFYRLVVLDSRKRRDGAYLANLGYYNPFAEPPEVQLHTDDIMAWLAKGAVVSDSARALLKREGVLYRYSLVKSGADAEAIDRRMAAWSESAQARSDRRTEDRRRHLEQIEAAEQERRERKQQENAGAESEAASADAGEAEPSGDSAASAEGSATEERDES
jgi:small subunit ribosomal protein S16